MKKKPNNKNQKKKKYASLSQEEKEQLFNYYKDKKDEIIKERYKWLRDIDDINNSIDLYHEKEWDLRKLSDKIIEYQLNLSEANIALINERKKIINFINEIENDRCKLNISIYFFIKKLLNYYKYSKNKR